MRPTRRNERGHAIGLIMAALVAVSVIGGIAARRIGDAAASRPADDRRIQLLWLARSAAARSPAGAQQVQLGERRITVRVRAQAARWIATAEDGAHRATIELTGERATPSSWSERYERTAEREARR